MSSYNPILISTLYTKCNQIHSFERNAILKGTWRLANDGEWQCCWMLAEQGEGSESSMFIHTNWV
jgi:hypothetical protein